MMVSADRELAQRFLQEDLGVPPSADFRGAIFAPNSAHGQPVQKGNAAVVVGWHNFTGRTCNISLVVQKPEYLTRWVIQEIFRFPFEVCKLNAVVATVDSSNEKSLEICRRGGFRYLCTIEGGGHEADLVCFVMYKNECRWLRKVH